MRSMNSQVIGLIEIEIEDRNLNIPAEGTADCGRDKNVAATLARLSGIRTTARAFASPSRWSRPASRGSLISGRINATAERFAASTSVAQVNLDRLRHELDDEERAFRRRVAAAR